MSESASVLSAWESFYVIVGSSAGALIGLQFVVITLIAASRHRTSVAALSAFGTPTVVHLDLLRTHPESGLFLIGAAALGLLLLGIRNAWDTVTHIVVSSADRGA